MFDSVILAAGNASRMGTQKLLLPYQGIPLVRLALEAAIQASRHVVLVIGFDAAAVISAALGNKEIPRHLSVIVNPEPQRGQFSSTQEGLASILGDIPFAITVADLPKITTSHYKKLEQALAGFDAVRPRCSGVPGHPVLCAPHLRHIILQQQTDTSMHAILNKHEVYWLEDGDDAWTSDVDTPSAYRKLVGLQR